MKKIIFLSFIILIVFFLGRDGIRYVGKNYIVTEQSIPNTQKVFEFFDRSFKYKRLTKSINTDTTNKDDKVLNISKWIYKNVKKIKKNEIIIDNHPWTIIERRIATDDQYSDILSVLLIYADIESFFYNRLNSIWHPITFFSITKKKWSILDPYYGVYFLDSSLNFSTLDQDKNKDFIMHHLILGKINENNFRSIFTDKKFDTFVGIKNYYINLLKDLPTNQNINSTHIYKRGRGSRSYIQKPLHRFLHKLYMVTN